MKCEKCKFFRPIEVLSNRQCKPTIEELEKMIGTPNEPDILPDGRIQPKNINVGECRRFPPKPDGKGTHTVDEFPTVRKDYWCGEYKKGAKK